MKCPIDDTPLTISSRDGVEIDFCPQCRGVWLDRGELDKIVDRAANMLGGATPAGSSAPPPPQYEERRYDDDRRYDDRRYDDRDNRKRRKRSFLDDLFEFD